MADAVKMVSVSGVRYRPEDAPKRQQKADESASEVEHKMRTPRKSGKSEK